MKCGNCVYFRILKAKAYDNVTFWGMWEKMRSEELICADDPACQDYLPESIDPMQGAI